MVKHVLKIVKNIAVHALATAMLSILVQSIVALAAGLKLVGIYVLLQILLANVLIHIAFFFLEKVNMRFRVINYLVFFAVSIGLLVGFGFWFQWYQSFNVWVIAAVGVAVLLLAILLDALKISRDVAEINRKVKELRAREDNEERITKNE